MLMNVLGEAATMSLDGAWASLVTMWDDPVSRAVLIAAVILGGVLALLFNPLRRRVWLAVKPRGATKNTHV